MSYIFCDLNPFYLELDEEFNTYNVEQIAMNIFKKYYRKPPEMAPSTHQPINAKSNDTVAGTIPTVSLVAHQTTCHYKRFWHLERFLTSLDKMVFGTTALAAAGQIQVLIENPPTPEIIGFTVVVIIIRINILWKIWYCRSELNSVDAGEYRYVSNS